METRLLRNEHLPLCKPTFGCFPEKVSIIVAFVEPSQGKNINLVAKLIELRSCDVCRHDVALFNSQRGQALADIVVQHRFWFLQTHAEIVTLLSSRGWWKLITNERIAAFCFFLIKSGWAAINSANFKGDSKRRHFFPVCLPMRFAIIISSVWNQLEAEI